MNASIASHARRPTCSFMISATERARCRTLAMSADMSWTAPMKTTPSAIHRNEGPQPKSWQAMIGPAMGPAAAIALKCCPSRKKRFVGTKSTPSLIFTAGVVALSSSVNCFAMSRP